MQKDQKRKFLNADARHPLITNGSFSIEALIYHLDHQARQKVGAAFYSICQKQLTASTEITGFSGGERVILMALMSLYCPAPRLRFIDLWHALDPGKRAIMQSLIAESPKEILMEDSEC